MKSRINQEVKSSKSSKGHVLQLVKQRFVGMRLDQFIKALFPHATRGFVQQMIQSGEVLVDGKVAERPDSKVRLGAKVEWPKYYQERTKKGPSVSEAILSQVRVIAEDEHILALFKPAGLSMHPIRSGQAGTLVTWLSTRYPQIMAVGESPMRPGIVHRLDKETSGVVIVAKTQSSFVALKSLFQTRAMQKEYLALVYGNIKSPSGTINLPLGRKKGSIKRAVPLGKREFGGELREAVTEYELHTRYPQHDLLLVKPKTGRTHQIRVHLAALGHPIVGDRLYRFKEHRQDPLLPPYQLLHAKGIRFSLFGKKYRIEAPLPEYYSDILSILALQREERD